MERGFLRGNRGGLRFLGSGRRDGGLGDGGAYVFFEFRSLGRREYFR